MNFIAIDVETANADMSSICQIGIAKFRDGKLSGEWVTYLDPQTYFDEMNICLLYTSPSPRDRQKSRMPSSA